MFQKNIHSNNCHCDCNQHTHPHQVFFNELMREFDPNDPANKNRTFDKMVIAANRKHLNPGEQSFHYYIDKTDNKVHGFIAVGNINDRLPHIIIADNTDGKESALETAYRTLAFVTQQQSIIETLQAQIKDLMDNIEYPEDFNTFIDQLNELKNRVTNLEDAIGNHETIILIQKFITNNKEFITNNDTPITELIQQSINSQLGDNISDHVKDAITNDITVQQVIKEITEDSNYWNDL